MKKLIVKTRVIIKCSPLSPYNNAKGVIIRIQSNTTKTGETFPMYIVRLDKPMRPGFEAVGLPADSLEVIA